MRKTLLLAMILLVFAAWAVAQQEAPSPNDPTRNDSQASQPATGASSMDSIEGCLGGSASGFTVTDKAGTTYQLLLPASADSAKLSQHVGEEVRATGAVSNAAGSPSASSPSAPGSMPSAGEPSGSQPSIRVTKMDKIADTCSGTSGANPSK